MMDFSGNLYFSLLLAVVLGYSAAQTADYCNLDLCYGYKGHVACNANKTFAPTCSSNARIVPITAELISIFVQKHNALRHQVAGGFGNLQPAARMASMQWDQELADLAEFRSRRCSATHDKCRSTDRFNFVGQNIAHTNFEHGNIDQINVTRMASGHLDFWFSQYKVTTMDQINSYKDSQPIIGAFTGMIQEKANRIGCAIVQHVLPDGRAQHVTTCNYSYINIEGLPVYTAGPTASKCKTGRNIAWNNLCKVAEVYDVNEVPGYTSASRLIIN